MDLICVGINPGWADLLGAHYKVALKTIMNDMLGVFIEYGPVGIPPPNDTQINRVCLYLDENDNVANVPRIGWCFMHQQPSWLEKCRERWKTSKD